MEAKAAITFALYQGDTLVRRDTIAGDVLRVGKDPKSHLLLDDEVVSRMHGVIEVESVDDVTLIDFGNAPGTSVNGAPITKTKIRVGDEITIGGNRIVIEAIGPASAATAAPAAANPFAAAPVPAPAANPFAAAPAANPFAAAANPFAAASNPFANPFAQQAPLAAVDPHHVAHDAAPGTYTFSMIKSGPDVASDEVEVLHQSAVEVMISWDTNVLHVEHLNPPRAFYVGEEEGKNFSCDYFIPSEKIGTTRAPLVLASGGTVYAVLLPNAKGTIELPGQPPMTIADAIASGRAVPCAELAGSHQIALPTGGRSKIDIDGLVFTVSAVPAGRRVPVGLFMAASLTTFLFVGLSFLVHVGLLAGFAFFKPTLGGVDDEEARKEQQFLMAQILKSAADKEEEEKPPEQTQASNADNKEGGTGTRAKGEEGSMGNPTTKDTGKKYGVAGPQDNPDPHIARQAALREAAEFGIIGLLNTGAGGDPNAPTAPWGRDDSLGADSMSARGNMWGDSIGDSFGAGGLGLSGIGEGGGGKGEGIGLGSIGTIGHGSGTGSGSGFGSGHGRLGGSHAAKAPQVRMGATQVSGRLPAEVIQRIVRQNYGRFRLCFENGLRNNPNLTGRVSVRFVIDREGRVANVGNGGSDMPDSAVVSCVVRSFSGLSFPAPEGGIVTVVYPIMFSPGSLARETKSSVERRRSLGGAFFRLWSLHRSVRDNPWLPRSGTYAPSFHVGAPEMAIATGGSRWMPG